MAGSLGYGQTLALMARKYPNKIGFICGDKRHTYRQFLVVHRLVDDPPLLI